MRAQQQQHRPAFRTGSISDNSENEVDTMLGQQRRALKSVNMGMHMGEYGGLRDEPDPRGIDSC